MGNKALIVLDNQPDRCADCTLTDSLASNMCVICYRHISNSEYEHKKPDWCPIISLPDKKRNDYVTILADSYRDGWNDCIDKIVQNSAKKQMRRTKMDDTYSQIESCLKCEKKECNNCIELRPKKKGNKPEIMYDWNGQKYSANQLCEISGRSKSGLLHRIRIGGVDFAMSLFRKVEDYQKEKEPEKL